MYIYKTKLAQTTHVPSQLKFLETARKRGLLPKEKDQRLLRNLAKGAEGERYVVEMLEKYGGTHWVVVPNLWLEHRGKFESDVMLLTRHGCFSLEIKNYDGNFEYKKSRCYLNGKKLSENCVQQAEKAAMNLEEICHSVDSSTLVRGALLFVGEHNEVEILSEADGIEVVTRTSLRKFIQNIRREEEILAYASVDTEKILRCFERKEVLNPFGPLASFTVEEVLAGRRGISCKACGSYATMLTRKFLRCENGHEELRDTAVLRTIEEFRVLTFQTEYVTKAELLAFLGGQVSETYLYKFLRKYFVLIHNGRHAKYRKNLE